MFRRIPSLFALLSAAASAVACAAPTSEPTSDPETIEPEVVSAQKACSRDAYDRAFDRYKAAVDHAKARSRGAICEEGTTLYEIAADLGAAVSTCGKFESIIATSQWAAPVRDALAGNLALPLVTGKIAGKDLAGLEGALPGTTVFGPAPGVFGNMSKLSFAEGGEATLSRLEVSDEGEAHWSDAPARWSLDGGVLKIETEGKSIDYRIEREGELPELHLVPSAGEEDFRTMPSECEA